MILQSFREESSLGTLYIVEGVGAKSEILRCPAIGTSIPGLLNFAFMFQA